jgi:hypothetical protein
MHPRLWHQTQSTRARSCCPGFPFSHAQELVEAFQAAFLFDPFRLKLCDHRIKHPRPTHMPALLDQDRAAPRDNQPCPMEATASRQTVACASLSSGGAVGGPGRRVSTQTIESSATAFRPLAPIKLLVRIPDVYERKAGRRSHC